MIRRVLPHPFLFVALLVMWLMLNQSLAPGTFVFGALVAFGGSWAMVALDPPRARLRLSRLPPALRLAGRVLVDVFRSNLAVARIILGGAERRTHSGFMTLRLDLTDRYGLAVLAIIMTCTPGTQWVHYDPARGTLLLHVLDLVDERQWANLIKQRYETLLREIFE
ncbi:Na+/H+ antiporter subunit E [Ancylobacter amanitiformis]|uniref:Multicomponent K+:H+ antiporter subunit E n=1 Tax=Ancylobacter amanitiformis TaxID=217069 RepID=A0ABU0LLP1_9HYPH|nr:Na+/H+ antiporter subunit E [Ancylobacter amanitiformis]MDQ0509618.1 multicomponent K+:H+ antiporter subunit E [Ancylobacter amanitiformis]